MHKTVFRHLLIGLLLLSPAAFAIGCEQPCPGGHDPLVDPTGDECKLDMDCLVECVCERDGEERSVDVGSCLGGICGDATKLCEKRLRHRHLDRRVLPPLRGLSPNNRDRELLRGVLFEQRREPGHRPPRHAVSRSVAASSRYRAPRRSWRLWTSRPSPIAAPRPRATFRFRSGRAASSSPSPRPRSGSSLPAHSSNSLSTTLRMKPGWIPLTALYPVLMTMPPRPFFFFTSSSTSATQSSITWLRFDSSAKAVLKLMPVV